MRDKKFYPHYFSLFTVLVGLIVLRPSIAYSSTCLWVSSYHQGYEWEDGIQRGIEATLNGKCEIQRFSMDTKRNPDPEFGRRKAAESFAIVQSLKPDVIIASDDNASRYFVKPYLKNGKIPVVFCGVNWTVEEYGYPYENATGMVEFSPVIPLYKEISRTIKHSSRGLYLSADVQTERTEHSWYTRLLAEEGVTVEGNFVKTMEAWEQGYLKGQDFDFIVLGPYSGINDWDTKRAELFTTAHTGKMTVTTYDWMMPYAMLGTTKSPEEQGEWAGNVAIEILDGMAPSDIHIVPNRKWDIFINPAMLERAGIQLRQDILIRAIKVQP